MRQDGHVLCNAADIAQEQGRYHTTVYGTEISFSYGSLSIFGQICERPETLPSMFGISRRPRLLLTQLQLMSKQDFEACAMDICK